MKFFAFVTTAALLLAQTTAHYTFPSLIINGQITPQWTNVRQTNNYNTQSPVTDVNSADFRCYTSQTNVHATTINVAAGSQIGIQSNGNIYHPGVGRQCLHGKASNGDASSFTGDGNVWFKVYELAAVTNGGSTITFPAQNLAGVTFTLPKSIPSGQYLIRMEAIALHSASSYQGDLLTKLSEPKAQFYISCGQINVTGGGSGNPGPLVAIPGVYTGREPGIMLNIYYPIPVSYTQPGPVGLIAPDKVSIFPPPHQPGCMERVIVNASNVNEELVYDTFDSCMIVCMFALRRDLEAPVAQYRANQMPRVNPILRSVKLFRSWFRYFDFE
ncbi:hypothetical protein BDN72DRAFT_919814 [Pluteus cervinus]|uniref:Uncharacterized protein n=1 Tax=Pluteus cervinus TaxID=181527 RepID=A0ACD3B940_9AGAR|nr:hypothetical protein BDN72DRAFT_919814 [Pluteus cervinus]